MPSKQRVARLAAWSIPVALAVLALKFAAWWITDSVALYSDALESIVNVIAAFFALWAIRVSHLPADDNHPFGHHKAEYLSAVVEGALIIVAALLIFREAFFALQSPLPLERPWAGLVVNAAGGAVNAAWAWVLIRAGRQEKSPALDADGRHILTDVWTSAGVIVGLVAAVSTGWVILDPLLAIAVAMNIVYQGWRVIGSSVQGLMDVGVDAEQSMRIREVISSNAGGALEVHDLKTRIAGRATFIEFHLVVDAAMSVGDSHVICDRIEAALKAEIPSVRVVIHVEPDDEAKLPRGTVSVPFA
ncbi:MAG: cation-efflux pump [Rhizobiales bacterium 65-79]|jgi:cation diffusion facilitator family transporter|nr:cation transporter [Hyphomicrobiales bacterium]OJU04060.1 MAG: cation-efflux pump [Rhizobiales bacterium 65-79]